MSYTDEQMAAALDRAGVPAGPAAVLVATSHPESGASNVVQQGQPYATTGWGVWQITPGNSEPQFGVNQQLLSLWPNAEAAAAKWRSQGLGAWTTVTSGADVPYLPAAEEAVSKVYAMSPSQVAGLVSSAGSGGQTGTAQTTSFLTNPVGGVVSAIGDLVPGLFNATDWRDLIERFGLIVLGGLLIIIGIWIFIGREAVAAGKTAAKTGAKVAEVAALAA